MPLPKKLISSESISSEKNATLLKGGRFILRTNIEESGFKARNLLLSISFAFEGLVYAAKTQRNFRIQLSIAFLVLVIGITLGISLIEWVVLWGIIGLVLFAELMNTALELLVDMLTGGCYDQRAKIIKDLSAAAVLITAISALIIGIYIFASHFII